MAVRIRLTRTGARNAACFRVVAADSRSPRDGRFLEILGWYDPRQKAEDFKLDADRIAYWVDQGAEVSETVRCLIKRSQALAGESADTEREAAGIAAAAPTVVEEAPAGEAAAAEAPGGTEASASSAGGEDAATRQESDTAPATAGA